MKDCLNSVTYAVQDYPLDQNKPDKLKICLITSVLSEPFTNRQWNSAFRLLACLPVLRESEVVSTSQFDSQVTERGTASTYKYRPRLNHATLPAIWLETMVSSEKCRMTGQNIPACHSGQAGGQSWTSLLFHFIFCKLEAFLLRRSIRGVKSMWQTTRIRLAPEGTLSHKIIIKEQ